MISVCLIQFVSNSPWGKVVTNAFSKALLSFKNEFTVEIIEGYPQKKYDIIILIGIRSIVKRNLDPQKILPYCNKLIDMGDSGMDPRKNFEDLYFYFVPSKTKLHKHYVYLPKFIITDNLYPEKFKDDKLTVYVDHFKYQNKNEKQISIKAINKIFDSIKKSKVPLRVFYHTSKGIELDRLNPEISDTKSQVAKFLPFEEIAKYYRKADIFFPTHRETQGMVAQEIAACGGVTILQPWMYPQNTHNQFAHMYYNQNDEIDFISIKKNLEKISLEEIREHTLKSCGFDNFKKILYESVISII